MIFGNWSARTGTAKGEEGYGTHPVRNTNFAVLQKKTIVDVLQILYFTVQHIILSPQKPEEKPRHKPTPTETGLLFPQRFR